MFLRERARALAGRDGPVDPLLFALVVVVILGARVGDRGVGEGEAGIDRHRVLEHLERELQVLPREPARVALAAEIQVVRLEVLGRLGRQRLLLLPRQRDPQSLGDLARDLVLQLEDVLHLAVVPLGPDGEVRVRVHELRVDAQPRPGPAKAPAEDVGRAELLSDLRRRDLLVAIRQHRGTREDLQALDLRELRDDVLGHAVAEVFVLFDAAQVLEVQNRDRLLRRSGRARGSRRSPPARGRCSNRGRASAAACRPSCRSRSGSGSCGPSPARGR